MAHCKIMCSESEETVLSFPAIQSNTTLLNLQGRIKALLPDKDITFLHYGIPVREKQLSIMTIEEIGLHSFDESLDLEVYTINVTLRGRPITSTPILPKLQLKPLEEIKRSFAAAKSKTAPAPIPTPTPATRAVTATPSSFMAAFAKVDPLISKVSLYHTFRPWLFTHP